MIFKNIFSFQFKKDTKESLNNLSFLLGQLTMDIKYMKESIKENEKNISKIYKLIKKN